MCLACLDYMRGKLTLREFRLNLYEVGLTDDDLGVEHANEIISAINEDVRSGKDLDKKLGE